MAIDRTLIIRGPAIVQWDGFTDYTAGDVVAKPVLATFKIPTSFYGDTTDERAEQLTYEISYTPAGRIASSSHVAKVHNPICALAIGDSILGATDRPLVVHAKNGEKHTFPNAFPSKPCDIVFSSTKPPLAAATFTALIKKTSNWSDADVLHKQETASFTDATFDASEIPTGLYNVNWGATTPFLGMAGAGDGVLSLNPTWEPVATNNDGIVDYRLKDLTASFKFQPVGVTLAQMRAAMVNGLLLSGRGASLANSIGLAFSVTGPGTSTSYVLVSADSAAPVDASWNWGVTANRVGEVEFRINRVAPAALLDISILAI